MKLNKLRNEKQPKIMIIPMIDIIFFLLVFFMLSTLYMVEQHSISLNLPQTTTSEAVEGNNINISILSDGKILFDKEEIPLTLVKNKAIEESVKNKDVVFILSADESISYKNAIAVVDELKTAKVGKIALATKRKEE